MDSIKKNAQKYDSLEYAKKSLEGDVYSNHKIARHKKQDDAIHKFLQNSDIIPNSIALDIGCSGGRNIRLLSNNGFKPYGIDTAMTPLKYAKSVFANAELINASATHIPFKKHSFDVVLCIEVLHHFDDYFFEKILQDVKCLIKPGGTFIFDIRNSLNPVMWCKYKMRDGKWITLKTRNIFKVVQLLEKNGFRLLQQKSLFFPISILAPYIIVFCKYDESEK